LASEPESDRKWGRHVTQLNDQSAANSGGLTFAAGEKSKAIVIEVAGGSKRESVQASFLQAFGKNRNAMITDERAYSGIPVDTGQAWLDEAIF
jgi:hypothetical protein